MVHIVDNLIKADKVTSDELYNYLFPETMRGEVRDFIYNVDEDSRDYRSEGFTTFFANEYSLFYLYVRVRPIDFDHPIYQGKRMLVIANIKIDSDLQKQGVFKKTLEFLEHINPYDGLMVECVTNRFLKSYLEKNGFKRVSGFPKFPSVFKERTNGSTFSN